MIQKEKKIFRKMFKVTEYAALTSHKQLRSYGVRATALTGLRQTGGAGDQT